MIMEEEDDGELRDMIMRGDDGFLSWNSLQKCEDVEESKIEIFWKAKKLGRE